VLLSSVHSNLQSLSMSIPRNNKAIGDIESDAIGQTRTSQGENIVTLMAPTAIQKTSI
jgi:hypothetical protein